jgi:hypothetical protein
MTSNLSSLCFAFLAAGPVVLAMQNPNDGEKLQMDILTALWIAGADDTPSAFQ